jgi:type I restriction enzyme M protein
MKEVRIQDFSQFHEVIDRYDARTVIYAFHNESYIDVEEHPDLFKFKEVGKFIPRHLTQRITTQGRLSTVHPEPYVPFESEEMERIVISGGLRSRFRETLNKYGVNRFSLFPGLDGLASHIEWLQSKKD